MNFFKKKKSSMEVEIEKVEGRIYDMADSMADFVNATKNELLDIIFATALASGVSAKKLAKNYSIEGLEKFAKELLKEVNVRLQEEKAKQAKSIKNVYDKASKAVKKTTPQKKKAVK